MSTDMDRFGGVAVEYARRRPSWPVALFEWLAEICPSEERAWDVGTGNGQAAVGLAAFFDEVVATDCSEGQLAAAFRHPRIAYRHARAERSGLETGSVDCILAAQAAHWFDRCAFYDEAIRVGRAGAPLVLACYQRCELPDDLNGRFRSFYDARIAPWWPAERRLVDDGYASISLPFDDIPVPRLSMSERWTLDRFLGYVATWSSVQAARAATGEDLVQELLVALGGSSCGWPERRVVVTWPLGLRACRLPGRAGLARR